MDCGKRNELHLFFFPFMAQGHAIPLIDMAKLFASRGQKAGLPEGCEHLDLIPSPEMELKFMISTAVLAQPLEQVLIKHRPDCLVSDTFFPWSNEVASKCGIPRIVFTGTGFFSSSVEHIMNLYQPYQNVSSDTEPFVIPNFPGEIKMTRNQVPDFVKLQIGFSDFFRKIKEVQTKSYGLLVNSFSELESAYADHYRKVLGMKAWHIGPISLCNRNIQDQVKRGKEASIDENECLEWLNSKKPNSVVYISYGSVADFTSWQLLQIAMGLEDSEQQFIWVVKKSKKDEEDWLPEGFEKRMKGKGLVIRGWAPQVLILEHEAVGGFVTHCGWNSTLEAVSAGVPMVTWPLSAEQFYNEKLITEVLKIGVSVGVQKWIQVVGDTVKKEAVNKAVRRLMVDEEAKEMRCRVKKLGELARNAVAGGGSSHSDFNNFIEELRSKII